jgi:hypothetical protein
MATDQQVALKRSHRIPSTSSHISKAARQVVPAFLQKLYEYVCFRSIHCPIFQVFKFFFEGWSMTQTMQNLFDGQKRETHSLVSGGSLAAATNDTVSIPNFGIWRMQNFHRGQPDLLCLMINPTENASCSARRRINCRATKRE